MRKVLYPGSFDPVTNGHLDIIRRASRQFDHIVVGVVGNPNKRSLFTPMERMEMIRRATADLPNVSVDAFEGLLADYVRSEGFTTVIRSLRSTSDFNAEIAAAQANGMLYGGQADTLFFMTRGELSYISSSTVKEIKSLGGDVSEMVPPAALEYLERKFNV